MNSGIFSGYSHHDKYGMMYSSNFDFENKIRTVVREEIDIYMQQYKDRLAQDIETGVLSALCYDVQTIADVSIGDVSDMISSEKVSSFVSGKIAEEIGKRIHNFKLTIA
ncbi:MAG: hypothetical protein IJV48_04070 [Ruminococcus sp.]|nr:hypothetical protein [Ruminococcus sp.]